MGSSLETMSGSKVPVSVVIPCYRCRDTIGRAVLSVLEQTAPPREIVLVEDASNDSTLEKLHELARIYPHSGIRVYHHHTNQGPSAARNFGWDQAGQPFIAFLDADDSWHPRKLELQYAFMRSQCSIVLTGHACGGVSAQSTNSPKAITGQFQEVGARSLLFKNRYLTPSVMLRRDLPFRFPVEKRFSEDYLLWTTIALTGGATAYSKDELALLHKPAFRTTGLSSKLLDMEKGELDVFWQLYGCRRINLPLLLAAGAWSLLKYVRRVIITGRFR